MPPGNSLPESFAHDALLGALWQLESVETIKLVARIYDERIGNNDKTSIYVCFADTHLISRDKIGVKYRYGFNHEKTFVDIIKAISRLQRDKKDYQFMVIQLGDFVDLWKENTADPRDVLSQYQGVRDYLYGLGKARSAGCHFVLGNHDGGIAQIPSFRPRWSHRLFISPGGQPRFYLTHGDVFDWIEKLPEGLRQWAVYYFSPKSTKPNQGLAEIVEIQRTQSIETDMSRLSQLGSQRSMRLDNLEPRFNVAGNHKFLESGAERVQALNKEHSCAVSTIVIGHTHNAQLALLEDKRRFFVLMDCGAWCSNYAVGAQEIKANGQIGVICGNDLRIYQIDSRVSISPQFQDTVVL